MFDYIGVQEAAKAWGLSKRRVQKLCEGNRIDAIVSLTRAWLIPKDTQKALDSKLRAEEIHINEKNLNHRG